jgi:D-alanine-D-alanine ligase
VYYITRDRAVIKNKCDFNKNPDSFINGEKRLSLAEAVHMISKSDEFIFSLLHGQMGEDGHFQGIAKAMGIMGTFGSVLSSSLSMSKYHMAQFVAARYPQFTLIPTILITATDLEFLSEKLNPFYGLEIVVKPNSLGASLFTEKITLNDQALAHVEKLVSNILRYDTMVLVQRYIAGKEYSCGCLEIYNDVLVLPLINIKTKDNFFGHQEKHKQGKAVEILVNDYELDSNLTTIKEVFKDLFTNLLFENMCRFDFIVSPDIQVYFLEANPLPGLMKNSIFPKMIKACGIEVHNLPEIFYENSLSRNNKETKIEYEID